MDDVKTYVNKEDYLNYINNARKLYQERYQKQLQKWVEMPEEKRGEKPLMPTIAGFLDAVLYTATGDLKYAQSAKEILLNGQVHRYPLVRAIRQIRPSGILSDEDIKALQGHIIKDLESWRWDTIIEWGAMNHSTNYLVDGLTAAANFCPDHPEAKKWRQMAEVLLETSWGKWSIEDSENYIPIWIKPLVNYADETGRQKEFFKMPTTKYYFDYFLNLISPFGSLVDFGDSNIPGNWSIYVALLERGATEYHDSEMKWGAHFLFATHGRIDPKIPSWELEWRSLDILDAYLWSDDSIEEKMPTSGSRQVLEDAVGKKIVFRSGWDKDATYLMLNYQGREDYGLDGRNHLMTTIPVEAEKNHHGHADENAICQLMYKGTVLLHESNYRETSTTGAHGEYRADVFHNRIVARRGLIDYTSRLLPQIMDYGRHRWVRTRLMFFHAMNEVDVSRSRVLDEDMGYQWDRVVNYLKKENIFVIFDIIEVLRSGHYNFSNLLWTRQILSHGRNWFDTWIDKFWDSWEWNGEATFSPINPHRSNLIIYFCETEGRKIGAEQARRSRQNEICIYNCMSNLFEDGNFLVFSTILAPHDINITPQEIVNRISPLTVSEEKGVGVKIDSHNGTVIVGSKLDLELGWFKDRRSPAYIFETGKIEYAGTVTDASMFFLRENKGQLSYAVVEATKLLHNGKEIFATPTFYRCTFPDNGLYDAVEMNSVKWPCWESKNLLVKTLT